MLDQIQAIKPMITHTILINFFQHMYDFDGSPHAIITTGEAIKISSPPRAAFGEYSTEQYTQANDCKTGT